MVTSEQLQGTMGKMEMERAIALLINLVMDRSPPIPKEELWRLLDLLREVRFIPVTFPEGYTRDGLYDLLHHGWAMVDHHDIYKLSEDMIDRIRGWISDGII